MKDSDLSQFTGTSQYYKISPLTKAVLTDGSFYVAKETDNFGLMQDIGIDLCHHDKVKKHLQEGLILIKIDTEGSGLIYEDGNGNKIHSYPLYGYPPLKIELFSQLYDIGKPCIFLKSEY